MILCSGCTCPRLWLLLSSLNCCSNIVSNDAVALWCEPRTVRFVERKRRAVAAKMLFFGWKRKKFGDCCPGGRQIGVMASTQNPIGQQAAVTNFVRQTGAPAFEQNCSLQITNSVFVCCYCVCQSAYFFAMT